MGDWAHIGQQVISRWLIIFLDVAIVAFLIYRLLLLARGTRAWQLMLGLLVFSLALFLTDVTNLETIHWLLDRMTALGPVAIVILFFPELRRLLESIGRVEFWRSSLQFGEEDPIRRAIREVVTAVSQMARERIGALIVWERSEHVGEGLGIDLHAEIAAPLLKTIFYPGSPLHDGAVILRGCEIIEAAVYFAELSQNPDIPAYLHTRHRAGIGATEQADCIAIIVSEERGRITLALGGNWTPDIDADQLQSLLEDLLIGDANPKLLQRMGRAISQVRLTKRANGSQEKRKREKVESSNA